MNFHILLLILHVLGSGVIMGVVIFSLFLSFRKSWSQSRIKILNYIVSFGVWASIWQLVTGIVLASSEWDEFSGSSVFWIKIIFYVTEGVLASLLIERKAKQLKEGEAKPELMIIILIHAVLIVGIIGLGVLLVSGE